MCYNHVVAGQNYFMYEFTFIFLFRVKSGRTLSVAIHIHCIICRYLTKVVRDALNEKENVGKDQKNKK